MSRLAGILLSLALFGALACDGAKRNPPIGAPSGSSAAAAVTFGKTKFDVTLILSEKDRRHAVPRLAPPGDAQGYLLAWPRERFMKIESEGAPVAFDVVFLDKSGAVVDLQPLKAHDPEGVQPKTPAAYALLVASGAAGKASIRPGEKSVLSPEVLSARPEELAIIKINGIPAHVELALTEPERQHGLMFRPRMSPEDGMLFAYPTEGGRSFWMANTLIPLDIAFFADDGTLLNVNETPMYPDPRNPGPNYATSSSQGPARYVLEMNLGWFKKKGIVDGSGRVAPGTKAELPAQATKGSFD
jgi:uncharacterized membrane protein (UPF0127 family)